MRPFGTGDTMPGEERVYGVNLGCLENVTAEKLDAAPVFYAEGARDRWQQQPAFTRYLERGSAHPRSRDCHSTAAFC